MPQQRMDIVAQPPEAKLSYVDTFVTLAVADSVVAAAAKREREKQSTYRQGASCGRLWWRRTADWTICEVVCVMCMCV